MEAVLEAARNKGAQLEELFDVPVVMVVSEESELDGATSVTAPGSVPPPEHARRAPTTYIVPIQPRYRVAGSLKLSFGRSTVCDLVFPFPSISKHHGYFEQLAQTWSVLDVGSTNGTAVDGQQVSKSGTALADGCTLQLGKVSARFLSAKAFCGVLRERLSLTP